jgi:hypothetical protein
MFSITHLGGFNDFFLFFIQLNNKINITITVKIPYVYKKLF